LIIFSEIKDIVEMFGSHLNIDLQQRGVEFSQLFGPQNQLRDALLEKMPAMTINRINGANGNGDIDVSETTPLTIDKPKSIIKSNTDTLLDLLGSGDDIIMSTPAAAPTNAPAATSNLLDLLGDIDLSTPAAPVMITNNNNNNLSSPLSMSILDDNENSKIPDGSVFGLNGGSAPANYDLGLDFLAPSATTTLAKIVTAWDKNDLLVQLAAVDHSDHQQITMTTTNNSMDTLEQYLFQVSGCSA
jgi:AP-1 complex subunit gamma-1